MTDQLYVATGYVVNGYTQYQADASSDLSVSVSVTATGGVIRTCDANLLLVDAFQDVVVNRTRAVSISTEAIFTELAAIAKIGDYFVNCEINSEVSANVHVISGGSALLSVLVDSYVQQIRLRDVQSTHLSVSEVTADLWYIKNCIANVISSSELSAFSGRTRDNHVDLSITGDLTARNYRLKDYAVDMQAFASEMTHNERVSDVNANLIAEAALSATVTRIKAIDANLSVDVTQSTYNIRVSEFHVSMDAFASELVVEEWVRIAKAQLSATSTLAIRNERISKANSNQSVDASVNTSETHLRTASANLVVDAANVTAFVRTIRRRAEFVMASDFTTRYQITRPFTSVLSASVSLTATGTVVKSLISNPVINASMASRPFEYRGFDSDLTVPTSVVTVPTRTSSNSSHNVVTASMNAVDVRIRLAQIHTDVVATELAAFGKIGAFFINSQVNTIMSCESNIIASGSSPMAVTATQTSRVEKNSDNRTNCTVDVSSSCRNIRVTNNLVNLVSEIQVNTGVSKVSVFNSQQTVVSTAHTRLFKLSELHSSLLSEVTQTSQLIRQNFARSSMSTAVTLGSQARRLSRNSSQMSVTAESLIWANRLKETVVDIHFNASLQAAFRKIGSIRVNPMLVSADMVANGRLFYLDIRYGWNIESEDRNYLLRTEERLQTVEYEDRTFQMGRI